MDGDASERAAAAKKRLQEAFKANPEMGAAFKQSVANLRKPENMKPMVDSAARLFEALKAIQER